MLGRRWFRINERNGGSEKAAASRMGVSNCLLYDGFFSFAVVRQNGLVIISEWSPLLLV